MKYLYKNAMHVLPAGYKYNVRYRNLLLRGNDLEIIELKAFKEETFTARKVIKMFLDLKQ